MKIKSRKAVCRKAACIGLTALMSASLIAGQVFAFAGKSTAAQASDVRSLNFENVNGKVDLSQIKLDNLNKDVIKNDTASVDYSNVTRTLIITLEGGAVSDRDVDERQAKAEIEREQSGFLNKLKRSGVSYTLRSNYSTIANAVAIDVKLSAVKTIRGISGVSTVTVGSTYARPQAIAASDGAQENYSNIYASGIYNSSEYLDKADGSGMTVAILDTGLDYTHPAFSPDQMEEASRTGARFTKDDISELMDGKDFTAEKTGATVSDVYVNIKVPFAYDYADRDTDVYPSYSQHGTHVAGIVAGKADSYTNKDGYIEKDENGNEITFRGVAPEAQLVICKVFSDNLDSTEIGGAEAVDILDALEDCCNLNVDVINMSLGTSSGFSSSSLQLDDEGRLMKAVYEKIRAQGISLIVAASNEFSAGYGSAFGTNLATNPDSGTVGAPSTFTGAMSVASINGQRSSYLLANATYSGQSVTGGDAIYYEESRNEDSDAYNFINDLLGDDPTDPGYKTNATFKYVVIPGTGAAGDYTTSIKREIANKGDYSKVIAVVKRGTTSFKDKIEKARDNGADAIIVYNNVSGSIRMSLGDLDNRIPAISVNMDAGLKLTGSGSTRRTTGTITLNRMFLAGPFMNDYSSWGSTPDLKLKPDITSHGGEITSTVAGGYDEMSGTSMACPNLAGFAALFKSYLKNNEQALWQGTTNNDELALTKLTNNIMMSTATLVYDQNKLPYSPRKQGAGLATLKNVYSTKAYLYTDEADKMCEDDGRPKAELGDDPAKKGEYTIKFYVKNFGDSTLSFKTNSIFMTETLGADGRSVAEKAYLFGDDATWTIDGRNVPEGGFYVPKGESKKIEVTLKLSAAEKKYLDDTFKNGMFVEGFLQLKGEGDQCDLTLPFMGFYGDWKAAPMLDLDCFEIAADAKDTSLKDEDRKQPRVWATQAYGYYYNEQMTIPLGSFLYLQDEDKEHTAEYVYTDEEHISISRFNDFIAASDNNNYLTTTGIKALYAGLLRNAEVVTYKLTNVDTGEIVPDADGNEVREVYRVGKATASGGSSIPAQVLLELRSDEMGLPANGKYRMDFEFYFSYDDYKNGTTTDEKGNKLGVYQDNVFSMNFYIDYEAPILVDSRIRYQDRKDESGKESQKIYLDLDIYDNHYPQAVILCYSDYADSTETQSLKLATEYITPIFNPKKNTTNTVSIDVTEFYETYKGRLFVEIDDYALNHNVYAIDTAPNLAETSVCPTDFKIAQGDKITIAKNTATKLSIENIGSANISNFVWRTTNPDTVLVKNGEIFGVAAGTATVTATGANGRTEMIRVTVTESDRTLKVPTVSFGTMINYADTPVQASGIVRVNSAQKISLELKSDPWYYPVEDLKFTWTTSDANLATVDQEGNVEVIYEGDTVKMVTITATAEGYPSCSARVVLSIVDPYTVSGGTLSKYRGGGGELKNGVVIGGETLDNVRVLTIPTDKAITVIGDEAFEDNLNVEVVIIPKSVTSIGERAFKGCTNLKKICFISEDKIEPADSSLNLIERGAFDGCTALTTVDLSNCKVFTLDRDVFTNCTGLKEVIKMTAIGTAHEQTFAGCTSLESVDLRELHVADGYLFSGCTSLSEVKIGANTALGNYMFAGCTALKKVEINCLRIPDGAFYGCTKLAEVVINADDVQIGAYAFAGCSKIAEFEVNGNGIQSVGDYGFRNCTKLPEFTAATFHPQLGRDVFQNVPSMNGSIVSDGTLYLAPVVVNAAFANGLESSGVTVIGPNAFSGSVMADGVDKIILTGITKIGAGAFYGLEGLKEISLPDGLTEIADNAFAGTSLETITIPASVKKIGAAAFADCGKLASIQFAEGSQLEEIGARAFQRTAITSLDLPESVRTVGREAFWRSASLTTVNIPAVTTMGERVFALCPALTTATFGDATTTTGTYTFAANYSYYVYVAGKLQMVEETVESSLTNVTLGSGIKQIGDGAFYYCTKLTTVDLKNATEVGNQAFGGCDGLTTVTGIDKVTAFGYESFAGCIKFKSLDLASAKSIFYRAFFNNTELNEVTFGDKLEGIGDEAFAESALNRVVIPASCTYIGRSAFSGCKSLYEYKIAEGNKNYFSDDGVLYRYLGNSTDKYELCSYPTGKAAEDVNGVRTYTVKTGTVTIQAYAFYNVPSARVEKVILPYTLKSIGEGAFYQSDINSNGITTYQFESIAAPVLLEGISEKIVPAGNYSTNSFYYNNFVTYLANYASMAPGVPANGSSLLTILYPTNGTGYDNFVYRSYFGIRNELGERPEDDTIALKQLIESLESATTVASWTTSNTNKAAVEEFSEKVKTAHGLYNGLKTDYQREYVGQENIDKLFAIEQALKPVKAAFNIKVSVSSVTVDASSTHKSVYRVGEKFSFKGLKLLVTYDDYSQEVIDGSTFKLEERFDRALKATDEAVTLEGLGTTLSIIITVSEGNGANGGLPAYAIALIVVGGVLVLAAAAAVTLFILNKKGVITLKFLDKLFKKQAVGATEGEGASEEAKADATEEAEAETQVEEKTETDNQTEENSKANGEEGKTE
ncbi:MAG: leucine-rich repeat protein [Clostridia bacterium]|nr:leucine-rich repeat protein [Clostridia bacterium]